MQKTKHCFLKCLGLFSAYLSTMWAAFSDISINAHESRNENFVLTDMESKIGIRKDWMWSTACTN